MAAARIFEILIQGDASSALAAFKSTELAALQTKVKAGGAITQFGAIAAAGTVAAVAGLAAVGSEFDKAYDTIRTRTGATGKEMDRLKSTFKNVVRDVPTDFGSASEAISGINQRLGLTGKPLRELSASMLELSRITKTDLGANIETATRLVGDWGIKVDEMVPTMDKLFRASQESGIGFDRLSQLMVQFGSPLRALGLDFDTTAAMLSNFEAEGVNLQTAMPGLRQALKNFAGAGREPAAAMQETIDAIKGAKSPMEAMQIGFDVFGQRAGPDLAMAIREGRFEFDDLKSTIAGGTDTIRKAGADTADFSEKFQIMKNKAFVALEPVATRVFDVLNKVFDVLSGPWGPTIMVIVGALGALALAFKLVTLAMNTNPLFLLLSVLIILGAVVWKFRDQIVGAFGAAWAFIKDVAAKIWQAIQVAWDAILGATMTVWNAIWGAIVWVWNGIKTAVSTAINWVWGVISAVWNTIWSVTSSVWNAIWGAITWVWEGIKGGVKAAVDWVAGVLGGAWDGIRKTVDKVWGGIKDAIGKAWDGIKGGVTAGVNAVIGVINTLIGGLNRVLAWIPGVPDDLVPKIPTLGGGGNKKKGAAVVRPRKEVFATGGLLPVGSGFVTSRPTAVVGEGSSVHPEFVIPTDPRYRGRALGLFGQLSGMLMPGMQLGGILDTVGGWVSTGAKWAGNAVSAVGGAVGGFVRGMASKMFSPFNNAAKAALSKIHPGWLGEGMQGIRETLWNFVKGVDLGLPEKAPETTPGGGGGIGGGVERWRNVAIQALKMAGQSISWVNDLLRQMQHESGGNPNIVNDWDINAKRGTPSKGLMQTIDSTFNAYAGSLRGRGIFDPLANIFAAINYTVARYGDLGAWRRRGFKGYGTGGIVGPEGGVVHPGEMVLTRADQLRTLKLIRGGGGGEVTVNVSPGAVVVGVPAGASESEASRLGAAAGAGFLDVIARRRVQFDARSA